MALVAQLFMLLVIVIFCFPQNPAPVASTMNYTCLLLFGYILLTLVYYYTPVIGGVHWFQGPVSNIAAVESFDRDVDSEQSAMKEIAV